MQTSIVKYRLPTPKYNISKLKIVFKILKKNLQNLLVHFIWCLQATAWIHQMKVADNNEFRKLVRIKYIYNKYKWS